MGAEPEGDTTEPRKWLLRCGGMRVESPDGFVGRVVEPLYEHSARWDRPRALSVETEHGLVEIPLASVASVNADERRIVLAPNRDATP